MTGPADATKRLHRLLKQDLGPAVARRDEASWATTSSLPHEIRLHEQAGIPLVRVSTGAVVGARASKRLLMAMNGLNVDRAFSRTVLIGDKILVVAEMPVASLRRGDLESMVSMVLCFARFDAPILAVFGGRPVTDPPPELAPDLQASLTSWWDVLRASGTATARELAVWLDDEVGGDCHINHDEGSVVVVSQGLGIGVEYPFTLDDLLEAALDVEYEADD